MSVGFETFIEHFAYKKLKHLQLESFSLVGKQTFQNVTIFVAVNLKKLLKKKVYPAFLSRLTSVKCILIKQIILKYILEKKLQFTLMEKQKLLHKKK